MISLLNAHILKIRDQEFVLDIGRTTAASASRAFIDGLHAYDTGGLEVAHEVLGLQYGRETETAVCHQIQQMLEAGYFGAFPDSHVLRYQNAVLHLCLSRRSELAHDFSNQRDDQNMPPEIISQAIALSFQTIGKVASMTELHVGVGGESLDRLPSLERVINIARESRNLSFGLLTCDGTQDVSMIAQDRMALVNFDIAGPPDIQDIILPMADGSASSPVIERHIRSWIETAGAKRAIGRARITARFPNVLGLYTYLYDLGFRRIAIDPIRFGQRSYGVNDQSVESIIMSYERFVDTLLDMSDDMLLAYLNAIWGSDIFGKFITRLLTRTGSACGCPAGKAFLSVDVDGKVYSCPQFAGWDKHCLGTVEDGLRPEDQWPYLEELLVDRRSACAACWARYLCAGGCHFSSARKSGDLKIPDPAHCTLNRHLAALAIWLVAEIESTRPQVLRSLLCREVRLALQTGLTCPISDLPVSSEQQLLDQGLVLHLGSAEQMRGRIWRGNDDLSGICYLLADDEHLHLRLDVKGLQFTRGKAIGEDNCIAVRFAGQPTQAAARVTEYYITGDPLCVATREDINARDVMLCAASKTEDGGHSCWLRIPWTTLGYYLRPNGVFGINVRIILQSPDEDISMHCFPNHTTGIITLADTK